ncbi:ankyrin repeat domain-containing protein, partial [Mesorhizobium sp. M7A.F.Ca.US.014.04.1.1]|uniref:ankyrin repeat domain-containing protein n=1 Tax=Mesorhizobium sp. M7A.F.Ca.US.014.04.1.1 TaxID=2496744 RepID=UPI0019D300BA
MKKGLDLYSTDSEGNSAFNYAAKSGNTEMMDLLIEKDVAYKTLNKVGGNAMLFAAKGTRGKSNPLSVYEYLESKGVAPNATTKDGTTPLHILAASNDDMEVLNYFLKKGVNVEQVDGEGNNVLMVASKGNKLE